MRKIGLVIGFMVFIASAFGQQFLWSTVQDSTSKYLPLENVTKEVLTFYDQYKYYYDLAGFNKDGFIELFKNTGYVFDSWKWLYDINDLTVFSFIDNDSGRGSSIVVMCVNRENVNTIIFSNKLEQDAIWTHQSNREKFANWFGAINNNKVGSYSKSEQGITYRPGMGTGSGAGMGLGSSGDPNESSGKGIGYGAGNRAFVNIPDVNLNEKGTVYVEVHITEQGSVKNARIINTTKYPTTITSSKIQQDCIARALSAKYVAGKEELRIIVFK